MLNTHPHCVARTCSFLGSKAIFRFTIFCWVHRPQCCDDHCTIFAVASAVRQGAHTHIHGSSCSPTSACTQKDQGGCRSAATRVIHAVHTATMLHVVKQSAEASDAEPHQCKAPPVMVVGHTSLLQLCSCPFRPSRRPKRWQRQPTIRRL